MQADRSEGVDLFHRRRGLSSGLLNGIGCRVHVEFGMEVLAALAALAFLVFLALAVVVVGYAWFWHYGGGLIKAVRRFHGRPQAD